MPRASRKCERCKSPFDPYRADQVLCPKCRQDDRDRALLQKGASDSGPTDIPKTDPELRAALSRTLRQLSKAKASKEELVAAVYSAALDGVKALEIPPVPVPKQSRAGSGAEEIAVVVLSDLQLAKTTPTYNTAVCEQRIEQYAQKVIDLTEIQRRDHPVKEARVYMLGDLVEGEMIFPGQAFRIDASLYRQVVLDGPRIVSNFLRKLLAYFERVHVVGVIGNHGRIGKRGDFSPESNADRMLYSVSRLCLSKEERITWNIPDGPGERNWFAIDQIGDHRYFLFHGDQMRGGGFAGLPFYGFSKAINSWSAGAIPGSFDYALCGHWHQAARLPFNGRTLWVNGSTESTNTYAQEELKTMADPSQWLLFAHPSVGVTAEYVVRFN